MEKMPPTVSTAELFDLLFHGQQLWLVRVPEEARAVTAQIPGSLVTDDEELLTALAADDRMVLYGQNRSSERAGALAAMFAAAGLDVRWYSGGVEAWTAAGHPIDLPGAGT